MASQVTPFLGRLSGAQLRIHGFLPIDRLPAPLAQYGLEGAGDCLLIQPQTAIAQGLDEHPRGFYAAPSYSVDDDPQGADHWDTEGLGRSSGLAVVEYGQRALGYGQAQGRGFAIAEAPFQLLARASTGTAVPRRPAFSARRAGSCMGPALISPATAVGTTNRPKPSKTKSRRPTVASTISGDVSITATDMQGCSVTTRALKVFEQVKIGQQLVARLLEGGHAVFA